MRRIKQNDEVVVISGRDRGKRGKVLKVLKDNRALISGVHMIKKHQKPNPNLGVAGGIIEKESSIDISNVALFDEKAGKASRIAVEINKKGEKTRKFKSSKSNVDG